MNRIHLHGLLYKNSELFHTTASSGKKNFKPEFRLYLFLLVAFLGFATGILGASRFMLPVVLLLTGAAAVQYGQWIARYATK